jgi:hypothetical protein
MKLSFVITWQAGSSIHIHSSALPCGLHVCVQKATFNTLSSAVWTWLQQAALCPLEHVYSCPCAPLSLPLAARLLPCAQHFKHTICKHKPMINAQK